ncbi:hypothetical protein OG943_22575 [Amycolatopsis sp. NBC_00345]|uniref:hypothetical protein n=1 Tax=Amycolatopsis sp. NBC_00345 TaxID=2975955 RepID=UPI002E271C08
MGALLEPTTEMGKWSVEVRRESAYLRCSGYNEHVWEDGPEPRHSPRVWWDPEQPLDGPDEIDWAAAFAVLAEDTGCVLAALDQILTDPGYGEFMREREPEAGVWRAKQTEDSVRLYGPTIAFGSREPWAVHDLVELVYSTLADLRDALASVVPVLP